MAGIMLVMALAQAGLTGAVPADGALPPPVPPGHIAAGSLVQLMVINEVSTRDAKPGKRFVVEVSAPVMVGDRIAIAAGTPGVGEITQASTSGVVGRSGKLATRLLYLDLNGRHVALSGAFNSAGQGAGAQVVVMAVLLNPLGVLARGNNGKLKAGQIISGAIAEDVDLDDGKEATP